MSIRFANSLTYSDSLFHFNGIESTHSSCSPPSTNSYLGNCQFLAKPKPQSHRPSSSSSNSSSYNIASSSKSFHPFPSKSTYRPTQSSRTPSPPNWNNGRSSRSTSPRYSNAVVNQPAKTFYSGKTCSNFQCLMIIIQVFSVIQTNRCIDTSIYLKCEQGMEEKW